MSLIKKKVSIGLEIEEREIRVVEISRKKEESSIIKTGNIFIPEGAVKDGIIKDEKIVGKAMEELWKDNKFSTKEVNLGLSSKNVMVRFIELPKIPKSKLKLVIENQAREYIPVDIENVVFDYEVLNEYEDKMEVLFVAVLKNVINSFLKALKIANLKPIEIESSILSLQRFFSEKTDEETFAVLNIGNCMNNILIINSNVPKLARALPTSVVTLTNMLGIDISEFYEFINSKEFINNEDILNNWIEAISNDLFTSVSYYQSTGAVDTPEKIYLCGKGAKYPKIASRLQEYLNVDVEYINPLNKFKITDSNNNTQSNYKEYSIGISLACRELED